MAREDEPQRRGEDYTQPQPQQPVVQPQQPIAPIGQQAKNTFNTSKVFFNQLDNGMKQKQPNLAAVGQRKLDTVGNVTKTIDNNTDEVERRTNAINKIASGFDYTKAFKPSDDGSDLAMAGTDENEGVGGKNRNESKDVEFKDQDTEGVTREVQNQAAKSGGTQTIGGKTINVVGNAEQVQAAGQQATDNFVKNLAGYYGGQENALAKFSDDANRFLDTSTADMTKRNLGTVADMNETELQDLSTAQMLNDPSQATTNVGALKNLSAWSGNALDSNIYHDDIQGLRNGAGNVLQAQEAAKQQAAQQNTAYTNSTGEAKKSLGRYVQSTGSKLKDMLAKQTAEATAKGKNATDKAVSDQKNKEAIQAQRIADEKAKADKAAADRKAWLANPNNEQDVLSNEMKKAAAAVDTPENPQSIGAQEDVQTSKALSEALALPTGRVRGGPGSEITQGMIDSRKHKFVQDLKTSFDPTSSFGEGNKIKNREAITRANTELAKLNNTSVKDAKGKADRLERIRQLTSEIQLRTQAMQ